MDSEDQTTCTSRVDADLYQQLRQMTEQDVFSRLMVLLENIQSTGGDNRPDVRISQSDFQLIRSLTGILARQERISGVLEQLVQEKDQQLKSIRHQLYTSQQTVARLERRLQMRDSTGMTESDTVTVPATEADATIRQVFSSDKTLPISARSFSKRMPQSPFDLEACALVLEEAVQNIQETKQSGSRFNVKPEFDVDRHLAEGAGPETGAPCQVTLTREYTDKVVQQNIRLKRSLRNLIIQRHGSVGEFLVRISPIY